MPVTKTAARALKTSRQKKVVNDRVRNQFKEALKKALKKPSSKAVAEASQAIDRAAKKRIIHANRASRLKSKLAKLLKK